MKPRKMDSTEVNLRLQLNKAHAENERLLAAANAVVDGWSAEPDEAEMDPLIGRLRDALPKKRPDSSRISPQATTDVES